MKEWNKHEICIKGRGVISDLQKCHQVAESEDRGGSGGLLQLAHSVSETGPGRCGVEVMVGSFLSLEGRSPRVRCRAGRSRGPVSQGRQLELAGDKGGSEDILVVEQLSLVGRERQREAFRVAPRTPV